MRRRRNMLIILAAILSGVAGHAQDFSLDTLGNRFALFNEWLSPEKVYLHMDRTYYTCDETIWFNGTVRNSSELTVMPCSNFIYVELLDEEGRSVKRIKIKRADSGFPGSMELPEGLGSGRYTLRAYTRSQMDGDPEYMFHQSIRILGPGNKKAKEPRSTLAKDLDITFYPEGGRWFMGHGGSISFKAMDQEGRSVEIKAKLVDQDGTVITETATRHDGMGHISLFATEGSTYSLLTEDGRSFPIPAPSTEGATINMAFRAGRYCISINGPALYDASLGRFHLLLRDISNIRQVAQSEAGRGDRQLIVNDGSMHEGINELILMDEAGHIYSRRMFYVYGNELKTEAACVGSTGVARADLAIKMKLADENGLPLDADCSVSVVRGSLASHCQNDALVSYMNLSSELKGTINDPYHYFDPEIDATRRAGDMDLLMMIQGWSFYDMDWMGKTDGRMQKRRFSREYQQTLTGHIDRALSKKMPEKFTFLLWIPKQNVTNILAVERGSEFLVDSLDFEDNTGFFIKIDRDEFGIPYLPKWNPESFAEEYRYYPAPGIAYAAAPKEDIPLSYEEVRDTIRTAVIVGQDELDGFTMGSRTSSGDLKFYSSWRLVDYIKMKTIAFEWGENGMVNTRTHGTGFNFSDDNEGSDNGSKGKKVQLVVDDMKQDWWMFENVTMSEVAALYISTIPDSFYQAEGGVVNVKFKSGAALQAAINNSSTEPSLAYFVPLGYQKPSRFYAPRYDKGDVNEEFDNRNTIYWNPSVAVKGGKAMVRFSNTDQMDRPYLVRIEGVTKDGRIFSRRLTVR